MKSHDPERLGRMSMEQFDFGDYKPHPEKRGPDGALVFVLIAMLGVLAALFIGYVAAGFVMSADVYGLVR